MTNIVDISQETIDSEWEALATSAGLDFSEPAPGSVPETEPGEAGAVPSAGVPAVVQTEAESLAMAKTIIRGGLDLALSVIVGVSVPADTLDRTAETWAAVVCKYYKGGIFEFLERFKDEIAAVGATLVLAGAVAKAKREKLEAAALAKAAKKDAPSTEVQSRPVERAE